MDKKNVIGLVAVAVLIVGGYFVFRSGSAAHVPSSILKTAPAVTVLEDGRARVVGQFACLPVKDTSATPACTLGLKSNAGDSYFLEITVDSAIAGDLTPDDYVAVTGAYTDAAAEAGGDWQGFNIKGIIRVDTISTE